MMEEKRKLLEGEWENIMRKVVVPLWHNEFGQMYESLKLDYDDFVSMAGYELTKAISGFDDSKSGLYTFATNVIKRKARTELRDYSERDKRKALSVAKSISATNDDGEETAFDIPMEEPCDTIGPFSEKRVGEYIKTLSNNQLRILILKLLDFDTGDIANMLNLSKKAMNDNMSSLKSNELTRILYRRNF